MCLLGIAGQTTRVLNPNFVYLAVALAIVGSGNYVRQTWRGNTQPHRVTWTLWALEGILAFIVEVQAHVGIASFMTLTLGTIPCLVLVASFRNAHAVWKIDRIDVACGVLSLAGMVFWALVNAPTVALVSFVAADFVAALPTYRKSWSSPKSETASAFIFGSVNCGITIFTLKHITTAGALFPGMIFFTDAVLSVLIVFQLGPRITKLRNEKVAA